MFDFFKNLQRRSVFKAAIAYAVASWLLLQVGSIVFPILNLGDGAMRILLIVLIVGFPLWVTFAYFFDWTPEGFRKTSDAGPDENTVKTTSKRSNAFIIAGLSLVVALLVADRIFNLSDTTADIDKSIAVLPFLNLSSDPDQEYFSDGLTDDILTQLAKIKAFRVISRTSVMKYKDDPPPIKEIAEQLNVGLVLEGSVQKMGDQVRITAQLIKAATDEHLWAESYDRPVDDLFTIQREVATAIAKVLRAQISPEESKSLEAVPTKNIAAYQKFQQGLFYLNQPHFDIELWEKAIYHFEEATSLDREFAEAYAQLAKSHARIYYLRRDLSPERFDKATSAANKAIELAPEDPEVQLCIGYYHLWAKKDKPTALAYFEQASSGLPNSVDVLRAKASIYEAQGKLDLYIQTYEKAVEISPLDASCWTNLGFGYEFTYQFDKGIAALAKGSALNPEGTWNYLSTAFMLFATKGAGAESEAVLKNVPTDHSWYLWSMFYQETLQDHFEEALTLVEAYPNGVDHKMSRIPQPLLQAYVYKAQGRAEEAEIAFSNAVDTLLSELEGHEKEDLIHIALGISYAGLGEKEKAIEHGQKAMELLPMSKSYLYGQPAAFGMAVIYGWVGEPDLACDIIERVIAGGGYLPGSWIEHDIRFDPLKDYPRFQQIVRETGYEGSEG